MSTKGVWYPDRTKATEKDPPLYLHITAATPEILQKALDKIDELMSIDLGSLVEDKKSLMKVKNVFLSHRLLRLIPYNLEAQMARRETSSRPRDNSKL